MTGTRFMGSTGSAFSKPMAGFSTAAGSTVGFKVWKPPTAPENANRLYASYVGTFSKQYVPSFDGTFRSRSTATGTMLASGTTREHNNQAGLDA